MAIVLQVFTLLVILIRMVYEDVHEIHVYVSANIMRSKIIQAGAVGDMSQVSMHNYVYGEHEAYMSASIMTSKITPAGVIGDM